MIPMAPAVLMACGLTALAAILHPSPTRADEAAPRQLTVTGTGKVTAQPDLATIALGVETQGATAAIALTENTKAMAVVMDRLKAAGIAEKDIQTAVFNIWPLYENGPDGVQRQKVIGYRVANQVSVRLRALDRLGAVLDQVVADGANSMNGLSFGVAEPEPLLRQARDQAVADALDKAQRYAKAAGVTLGPILSIDEADAGPPGPYPRALAAEAMARDVPVAPGESTLSASVTVVFAIE